MKRQLPDLRNARAGTQPKRTARADDKPAGLRVVNMASDPTTTEIWIYDEIDPWWGISAQEVADALAAVTTPNVRVRINSPGGDVFEGIAIMNLLASYTGTVTGVVDGLCASIATVIAMACETITMSPGSQMMIHPASGICFGDEADMLQMAALLGFQTNNIAGLYAARAGGTQASWLALMQAETWMTADESVTAGLADAVGVVKQSGVAVVAPDVEPDWDDMWDLSLFKFAGRAKAPAPPAVNIVVHGLDPAKIAAAVQGIGQKVGGELATLCACGQNGTPTGPEFAHKDECRACVCGPKNWRMTNQDRQHLEVCPARNGLIPRPTNLPDPVGVNWEVISNGTACDICEDVIAGSPYAEDDLPDVPVHPNCDCELQVAYGVDNAAPIDPFTAHFTSTAGGVVDDADELVRSLRKAYA